VTPRSILALLPLLLASMLAAGRARGQVTTAQREEARARFEQGLAHFDRREWSAALAEFLRSRELFPTRAATQDAAVCLREEGRFDEALDLWEALLREFPDLSPADRATADAQIAELRRSVGLIEVRGAEPGAAIAIDGRARGAHPAGALRIGAGAHLVRVSKDGFIPFEERVEVAGGQLVFVEARLGTLARPGPVQAPPRDRERPRFLLELDGAAALGPWLGGDVLALCGAGCSAGAALGGGGVLRGGYELGVGLGFAIDAGYLRLEENVKNRATALVPVGAQVTDAGRVDDSLRLSALRLGASASYHRGEAWPIMVRMGVGALLGSVEDARSGSFTNSMGTPFTASATESPAAAYVYFAPELRIGRRLGEHFELNVGVEVIVAAALGTPKWQDEHVVSTSPNPASDQGDGVARFGAASIAGGAFVVVLPGLGGRYEF